MSEQPLYGIWFKSFRGWLCGGLGHVFATPSLGSAIVRLLVARKDLSTEYIFSPVSGDVFTGADVCDDGEKMVVRSFDEWAKSEGLIE